MSQGEYSLHQEIFEIFQQTCLLWGMSYLDLLTSRLHWKVSRFMAMTRDPWADELNWNVSRVMAMTWDPGQKSLN